MKYLYRNKHWSINKEYNLDKLLYLMIDRSSEITKYNDFVWLNTNNQEHRDYDLPAGFYYYKNRKGISLFWRKNNDFYRENNKPAAIYRNGNKGYYINGKLIKKEYLK